MDAPRFLERQRLQLLERAECVAILGRVGRRDDIAVLIFDRASVICSGQKPRELEVLQAAQVGRGEEGAEGAAGKLQTVEAQPAQSRTLADCGEQRSFGRHPVALSYREVGERGRVDERLQQSCPSRGGQQRHVQFSQLRQCSHGAHDLD